MANQQIVPTQSAPLPAEYDENFAAPMEGFDGVSARDFQIPVIKIVQGVSRMEGMEKHGGEFWNSATGEFFETMDVVVLRETRVRSAFEKGADKPLCSSRDCITGTTYGACRKCHLNADAHRELWDRDAQGNYPLRCNEGYSLVLCEAESGNLCMFTAMKTAVAIIKGFHTFLQSKKLPLFGAIITLGTAKEEKAGNTWHLLTWKPKTLFANPGPEIGQYKRLSVSLASMNVSADVEDTDVDGNAGLAHDLGIDPSRVYQPPADDAPPPTEEPGTTAPMPF